MAALPRFLAACRRQAVDATPVWFMRQAGRYMAEYRRLRKKCTILELCERPELATEVTLQPVRKLGVDAAILFADILLPVRPMGLKLEFHKGEGPAIAPPVRGLKAVDRLREFDPREGLGFVLDAIRLIRRELPPGVPLIGFAGAPFTLASYMIEGGPSAHYLNAKKLMHGEPKTWHRLMAKIARVTTAYLKAQIEAGAQAVQLFDSWVGALSPQDFREFVLPHTRAVLESLKPCGVPVISFGTGTSGFLEDFASAGGDVLSVDWRIPLDTAWRRVGHGRAIQGNLDPVLLTVDRNALRRGVAQVLRAAGGRKGHIFNLGHGILPHTPVDHVRALVDLVHEPPPAPDPDP